MAATLGTYRTQMLWDAISKGDLTAVINLLENKTINLEERDENGQTFLMLACQHGEISMNGQTFLMLACQHGEISMVRELLEAGIDPNAVDNDNWSALLYAAKDGHLEITIELLERNADIEHSDMCNWTALMWACYNGQETVVKELLERGSDPNIKAEHNMSCLCWAAGRGHLEVVQALLEKQAKVNSTDRFGTTPLIWACRKGHLEIVQELLENGANVDNTGMDSLTALLVATKGGYTEVVQALLEFDPNVNAVDKDGFTALMITSKEGFEDIAQDLLAKDAYVNVADRAGDTILIHAVKGGFTNIVRALLNRYADVDVEGSEKKTALYWAVEKNHTEDVKLLLDNDADMEISTKDGDTPLMRAVRNRHEMVVRMLLDKGARVNVYDKKGDTALHISLRARSKRITELLLRNPRNSRLLYRPNKAGETPYSIDAYNQKGILTQIHGHRQLNASDGENLLGYEIYSSSLADILSEPSLNTPITVGLYAKWGSGKSFLLGKLQNEMRAFTKANDENQFSFTWSLFILLLIINSIIGSVLALVVQWEVGVSVGAGLFLFEYGFFGLLWVSTVRFNVKFWRGISSAIAKRLQIVSLLLQVLFCNPVKKTSSTTDVPLVKFLFSESTKLTSVGGEKALAAIVAGLSQSVEKEFGIISSRLFGVFKHGLDKPYRGRFKTVCCIPVFMIVVFVLICFIAGIALLVTFKISDNKVVNILMGTFAAVVGLSVLFNIPMFARSVIALCISQKQRIMRAADNIHRVKLEGFMQLLKHEVMIMNSFVRAVDMFTKNTTRLVVVVDGLDSCEQGKVLQVLDIIHGLFNDDNSPFVVILAVDPQIIIKVVDGLDSCEQGKVLQVLDIIHGLFNDDNSPFVVILAVDPQIIIKGIDQNLKSGFQDTTVNGFDYLRNIVHLPFYLQSQGLQIKRQQMIKSNSTYDVGHESPTHRKDFRHQESTVSQISGFTVIDPMAKRKSGQGRHRDDSLTQLAHSNFDISHTLTKNDYFSDINPKSMRRLMNIVAVTGRLLRAYNIDFNWYRLAAWVNLVEQWPFRLSWIVLQFEEKDEIDDSTTLKSIFDEIECQIPDSSEVEPLLEIDRNVRKFQAFLGSKSGSSALLNVGDLKVFLPCTINLDPYLRKLIRNLKKSDFQRSMYKPSSMTSPNGPLDQSDLNQSPYHGTYNKHAKHHTDQPAHYTPYGHSGMMHHPQHVHAAGYHAPPYMMGMGPYGPYRMPDPNLLHTPSGGSTKKPNPKLYIKGYTEKDLLSKMVTNQVCSLLARIEGINILNLPKYQQTITENNINGLVLVQCDLDQLRDCLQMKFGDWQLFRSAVIELRGMEAEIESNTQTDANNRRLRTDSESSVRSVVILESNRSDLSDDSMDMESRSKFGLLRQRSMDGQRDIINVDSVSTFDVIPEEDESMPPSDIQRSMTRNDSVVSQMMYETGLLDKFMQSFTEEHLPEEEEEEDSFLPNGGVMHENQTRHAKRESYHPRFQLEFPSKSESSMDEDENPNSERDPLISSNRNQARIEQRSKSAVPILKMPKKKVKSSEKFYTKDRSSSSQSSDKMPLVSMTSSGFSKEDINQSEASRDTVMVVDETGGEGRSESQGQGHSLQESIAEFTMEDLAHRKNEKDSAKSVEDNTAEGENENYEAFL